MFLSKSSNNLKQKTMSTINENELELIKSKAVQEYLLSRGANDEKINDKIRKLELKLVK